MIIYLTYNDQPSGIYSSQVIDVVKFIRAELKVSIRLVAFISLRGFAKNKTKIKKELGDAIVLPMFPGVHRWRKNSYLLKTVCLFLQPKKIIGRSVLATQLALKCRSGNRKIIYDGRGAIAAEWKEYGVISNTEMLQEISQLERDAINLSDARIAVSQQLVEYWKKEYNYHLENHVVIPCTLNKVFENVDISEQRIVSGRQKIGLNAVDTVYIYSGSIAGWQSFHLLKDYMQPLLRSSQNTKLVFLSNKDSNIEALEKEFPGQILCQKVSPEEVPSLLVLADYGLLIREESITNKVASPVKFAEYLACGLQVILSRNLGDYSAFVLKNACGTLLDEKEKFDPKMSDKEKNKALAHSHFRKINYSDFYHRILIHQN